MKKKCCNKHSKSCFIIHCIKTIIQ